MIGLSDGDWALITVIQFFTLPYTSLQGTPAAQWRFDCLVVMQLCAEKCTKFPAEFLDLSKKQTKKNDSAIQVIFLIQYVGWCLHKHFTKYSTMVLWSRFSQNVHSSRPQTCSKSKKNGEKGAKHLNRKCILCSLIPDTTYYRLHFTIWPSTIAMCHGWLHQRSSRWKRNPGNSLSIQTLINRQGELNHFRDYMKKTLNKSGSTYTKTKLGN